MKDMLRTYKSLNAEDFGDGKSLADTGLERPESTVTIDLKDGAGKYVLLIGNVSTGTNRWAKRADERHDRSADQLLDGVGDVRRLQVSGRSGRRGSGRGRAEDGEEVARGEHQGRGLARVRPSARRAVWAVELAGDDVERRLPQRAPRPDAVLGRGPSVDELRGQGHPERHHGPLAGHPLERIDDIVGRVGQ